MADSDIKLVLGQVIVQALDLCLDSQDPARRHNDSPHRRALVHDYDDGLTINWDQDYPGGVTIHGVVTITDSLNLPIPDSPPPLFLKNDVGANIASLKKRVAELEKKLVSIQANWRYCDKCKGLWFAGGADSGVCPKDGKGHIQQGSGNYRLLT